MIISVTDVHIKKGQKRKSIFCPIALALRDVGIKEMLVFHGSITLKDENGWHVYIMGPEETLFVEDFDEGRPVQPFSFELVTKT